MRSRVLCRGSASALPRMPSRAQLRRFTRTLLVAFLWAGLLIGLNGAARFKKPQRTDAAWYNARGICVFRFGADELPNTAAEFTSALMEGWRRSVVLPGHGDQMVQVRGNYPSIDSLRIDLSDASILDKTRPLKPTDKKISNKGVTVGFFELVGDPLVSGGAKMSVGVSASDVRFNFGKDKEGTPVVMLTDAKNGHLRFEMAHPDIEQLLLSSAQEQAGKFGLSVDKTKLKLTARDERSIAADLKLSTRVGFIPAGLHFRADVNIDDKLNARLSNLSCWGDEILGPLISGLIQPALKKYNGQSKQLVAFPRGDVRLRDVHLNTDDGFKVTATFGS